MVHIHEKIKCGKCGCEYCPNCYNCCPQCGKGMIHFEITTTTTINDDGLLVFKK